MCATSAVFDYWRETHPYPPTIAQPYTVTYPIPGQQEKEVNDLKSEVGRLRKELLELRKLLLAAKKFDEETGQPDCEMDEKVDFVRKFADMVGVDMSDVFPNAAQA